MRIVADAGIPLLEETFAQCGDITRLAGADITRAELLGADALLVRSVTAVNEKLLAGTRVRFVGTATSGTDHIDREFLAQAGIEFAHAHGCNADAVADYVCSALAFLDFDLANLQGLRIGIVGLGAVGSRVAQRLAGLGCEIKAYDPFLDRSASKFLQPWAELLHCDVLTLHTPLTRSGPHPSQHFLDATQFGLLPEKLVLINAARGAVVDNAALSNLLERRPHWRTVLDVWEGEPRLNESLLRQANIATPHIAGHSVEAKNRGSTMIYQAFLNYFFDGASANRRIFRQAVNVPTLDISAASSLNDIVLEAYDIFTDAQLLPELLQRNASFSQHFERLRQCYRQRHEFSAYRMQGVESLSSDIRRKLKALSFNV